MTLRPALSIAAISVAILSPLMGCADHEDGKPGGTSTGTGGSATGGMSPGSGGSGGLCSGAQGTAGGVGGSSVSNGGSAAGSSIPPTFETVKLVLQGGGSITTCAAAPCHGVNGMAPPGRPLELPLNDDQQLYTNLTTYISTACGNIKLVSPCDPAQSALPRILEGPCGRTPRMPYLCTEQDGNCIPDEYIAAIKQWIANGAPKQ